MKLITSRPAMLRLGVAVFSAALVAGAVSAPTTPVSAETLAHPSVSGSELHLSGTFDGLGFDVELRFHATLDEACDTGWVKPVLYAGDGSGFDDESTSIRSLGWREVTEPGLQRVAFRVTEPGTYGVALSTPDAAAGCVTGPSDVLPEPAWSEITLVRTPTVNLTAPVIAGTAAVGRTLSASTGTWQGPLLDYGYEWLRSGSPIDGATSSSYTLTADDRGAAIAVRVTASSHHDASTAESVPTSPVAAGTIEAYTPVITGIITVGQVLSVAVPEGSSYTYQWYRGTTKIVGATKATYTLAPADGGLTIKVTTVASRPGYTSLTRTSAATTVILKKLTAPTPTISGVVRVGTRLTAVPGAWAPAPVTLRYQWSIDGLPVAGQTAATFTPRPADLDKVVSVTVTGSKSTYATVAKTSPAAVVGLGAIVLPAPTISGTVREGSTLTALVGATTPAKTALAFEYQWLANGMPIDGATATTFVPDSSFIGQKITVRVTASNPVYVTRSATSAPTTGVVGLLNSSVPVLSGTARIDNTLCAEPGLWSPTPTLTYAWYLNGTKIATTSRCVKITSPAWKGMRLVVKVTGTKAGYLTRTMASAASAAIVVPDRTGPATVNTCPSWAPIKGNRSSMIYHMPGQRFYAVTNPEDCFRTEAAAVAAGYRKAKV